MSLLEIENATVKAQITSQIMAANLAETGIFGSGASGTLDDSAPLQARYLDTLGHRV